MKETVEAAVIESGFLDPATSVVYHHSDFTWIAKACGEERLYLCTQDDKWWLMVLVFYVLEV